MRKRRSNLIFLAFAGILISSCDNGKNVNLTESESIELSPTEKFLEGKNFATIDDLLLDPDFNRAFLAMTKESPLSEKNGKRLDALLKQVIRGSRQNVEGSLESLIEPVVVNPNSESFLHALQQVIHSTTNDSSIK